MSERRNEAHWPLRGGEDRRRSGNRQLLIAEGFPERRSRRRAAALCHPIDSRASRPRVGLAARERLRVRRRLGLGAGGRREGRSSRWRRSVSRARSRKSVRGSRSRGLGAGRCSLWRLWRRCSRSAPGATWRAVRALDARSASDSWAAGLLLGRTSRSSWGLLATSLPPPPRSVARAPRRVLAAWVAFGVRPSGPRARGHCDRDGGRGVVARGAVVGEHTLSAMLLVLGSVVLFGPTSPSRAACAM